MWFTGKKKRRLKVLEANAKDHGRKNSQGVEPAKEPSTGLDPIQLVGGKFSAVEAADVLISLINDKIRYHTIKTLNLSVAKDERTGSQARIDDLRKAKEDIKDLVVKASKKGKWVEINSTISLKLIENPQVSNEGTKEEYGFTSTHR